MPGESSVLADICRDFCFPRDDTPFTRESTATSGADGGRERTRGRRYGLLMKTQEASRRKTRPRHQVKEPAASLLMLFFSSYKVHVLSLFLNVAAFVPMYSRRLNRSDFLSLSLCLFFVRCRGCSRRPLATHVGDFPVSIVARKKASSS